MKELTEKEIVKIKKELPIKLGGLIRQFRENAKLTQTELAQAVGKDRQYLYKIEKGLVTPNISTIACIAEALEITISNLLEGLSGSDQIKS